MTLAENGESEEYEVDDFAAFILSMLDYDSDVCLIHLHKEISFNMAGESVDAKADVCLMDVFGNLILVQENKVS